MVIGCVLDLFITMMFGRPDLVMGEDILVRRFAIILLFLLQRSDE